MNHVINFQTMAPPTALIINRWTFLGDRASRKSGLIMLEAMVRATAVPKKTDPANSAKAAIKMALAGRIDLELITVAITLPPS